MTARIKTGGRRRGSLDKGERQLVTAEMAGDLLTVYKKLGGVKWLLKFAQDNPTEFLRQGLARLFPPPAKADDEPGGGTYNQFNFNGQSDFELARNIAFALSKAVDDQQQLDAPVAERVPGTTYDEVPRWTPPTDAPDMPEPVEEPVRYAAPEPKVPAFAYDAKDPRDYADQHAAWMLIRDTKECDISSYSGRSGEQGGGGRHQPTVQTKRSAAELCRSLSRRGRELL